MLRHSGGTREEDQAGSRSSDVTLLQVPDEAQLTVDVNRTKALELGLTQRDVANSLLVSLSSSFQTQPNYWVNPKNGVNYSVAVQTPTYQITI